MELKVDRPLRRMRLVRRRSVVECTPQQFEVILHDDAVLQDRDVGRFDDFARLIESRCGEDHVVRPARTQACGTH